MTDEIKYTRIISAVTETPWAILPAKLAVIRDLLAFRAAGGRLTAEEVRERMSSSGERELYAANGSQSVGQQRLAILPLVGTIIPRMNLFAESSGAISAQRFTAAFRAAINDPDVSGIILDVDSPGGQVGGVAELADEIREARGSKPITAVVNTLAASAAYWIASAADEIVITPSGQAGSIGVFAIHQDVSEALAREGIKINLISAGKYKTEGNPFEALTDEARQAMQNIVSGYYDMFVKSVAQGRGVKPSAVRNGFGEGRVVAAAEAVASGMADRIGTLDEEISRQVGGRRRRRSTMASNRRKIQIEKIRN